eukprot:gene1014-9920_t
MKKAEIVEEFRPFTQTFENPDTFSYELYQKVEGEKQYIDELGIQNKKKLIWSSNGELKRTYTFENTIQQVLFCHFDNIKGECLCVLFDETMMVYSNQGDSIIVPLPFKIKKLWKLPKFKGLLIERKISGKEKQNNSYLPILLSLRHPLEEVRPLCYYFGDSNTFNFSSSEYFCNPKLSVLYVDEKEPIIITFDGITHSIFDIDEIIYENKLEEINKEFEKNQNLHIEIDDSMELEQEEEDEEKEYLECHFFMKKFNVEKDFDLNIGLKGSMGNSILIYQDLQKDYILSIQRKGLNSVVGYILNLKKLQLTPSFNFTGVLFMTKINSIYDNELCLIIDQLGVFSVFSGRYQLCQFLNPFQKSVKFSSIKNYAHKQLNIEIEGGKIFRVFFDEEIYSGLIEKCFDVLYHIIPYKLYISLLKDFIEIYQKENEFTTKKEWNSFVNLILTLSNDNFQMKEIVSGSREFKFKWQKTTSTSNVEVFKRVSCSTNPKLFKEYLSIIFYSFHLLYESLQLNILSVPDLSKLSFLLNEISGIIGWNEYSDYYFRHFTNLSIQRKNERFKEFEIKNDSNLKNVTFTKVPNIIESYFTNENKFPFIKNCRSTKILEKISILFSILKSNDNDKKEQFINHLVKEFPKSELDLLPFGVSIHVKEYLRECQNNPNFKNQNLVQLFNYIDREDLSNFISEKKEIQKDYYDFDKDIGNNIFKDDNRLQKIYERLNSSIPKKLYEELEPSQHQQHLLKISKRICSASVGRGMMNLSTKVIDQSNSFQIPPLSIAIKTSRNVSIKLDTSQLAPNALSWPEFHNGCAFGFSFFPNFNNKFGITREWILYHRPEEMNYEYAGFLFSLGLQGYLNTFLGTDIYNYLSTKHLPTCCSILLSLSVSKRGTQDNTLTKALSCHILSLIVEKEEADIPSELQTCSLLGLGFLYLQTEHRFTTEVLFNELINPPINMENREGYTFAAGVGLGLINLTKGNSMTGLLDLKLTEKLKLYMTGGSRPKDDPFYKNHKYGTNKIKESDHLINIDITGTGSILALCFMYLQTNNKIVASYFTIPNTEYLLSFIRPEHAFLRILSQNLIMWDDLDKFSDDWIKSKIPIISKNFFESEDTIGFFNIIKSYIRAACCFSLGIKYAGSNSKKAYKFILNYFKKFEEKTNLDISVKENCLLICLISLSLIRSGTGDIETIRIINKLRKLKNNYGTHMALSMCLGILFLGAGRYSLSTSPLSIAALIISFYQRFPMNSNDNQYHLQLYRHLFVLSSEPRLFESKNIETNQSCEVFIEIESKDNSISLRTPCLLPELKDIKRIKINDDKFYPIDISLVDLGVHLNKEMTIFLKPKKIENYEKEISIILKNFRIFNPIFVSNFKLVLKSNLLSEIFKENCLNILEEELHKIESTDLKNYLNLKEGFSSNFGLYLNFYNIPNSFELINEFKKAKTKNELILILSKKIENLNSNLFKIFLEIYD